MEAVRENSAACYYLRLKFIEGRSIEGNKNIRCVYKGRTDILIRDYNADLTDRVRSGRQLDTTLALSVDDFYLTENTVETLTYHELNQLIAVQKMRGDANVKFAQIEKNTRFALPFSAFILTIMGVALSSKKRRGGIGWNIGIGIALAFTYILFLRFSQMFVHTDTLPPGIALWLPNMVFTIIAGFLYRIAPK